MKPGHKIFAVLFTLFLITHVAFAIDVTLPDASAPAEKTFTVEIQTTDLTDQKVFSIDFKVIYDAAILTATNVSTAGAVMGDWGPPTFNIGTGELRVSSGSTTALKGSGILAKIVFRVANNASVGASSPIAFASFMFNEGNPVANLRNGTFTVIQDTEPPQITSGPSAGAITSRSATIRWLTDEPATSLVDYGLSTGYGQQLSNQTLVTDHVVSLTGLKASKTYHYRVGSVDKLGNGPRWSSNQTFTAANIVVSLPDVALDPGTTVIVPITATDLSDQDIRSVRLNVRFNAELLVATGVIVENTLSANWPAPAFGVSSGQIEITLAGTNPLSGGGVLVKLQMVSAAGARIGQQTELKFDNCTFNSGEPPATTRNGSYTVKDTRPPQITVAPAAENITASGAVIVWQTDEKATSTVEFGKTSLYGNTAASNLRERMHRVTLSGLDPQTLYYFRVSSKDSSGNGPTVSDAFTFTTASGGKNLARVADASAAVGGLATVPVTVTDLTGQGVLSYTAVIQFDDRLLTFERLESGGGIASGWKAPAIETIDGQILVSHGDVTPLSGSGTLFQLIFRVKSNVHDTQTELKLAHFNLNSGAPMISTASGILTVTGNPDLAPPKFIFGPVVDQISTQSARVLWMTDEPATGKIEYGPTTGYGQVAENSTLLRYHRLLLTNLAPNTEYHVRALAVDERGNGPTTSADLVFKTLNENSVTVAIADLAQAPGSTFVLPLTSSNLSGLNVYSVDLVLTFDSQILTATQVSSAGTLTAGWGDPVYTINPGRILIPMAGVNALANSGTLVNIHFTVNPAAIEGVQTVIAFERLVFNDGTPRTTLSTGSLTIKDVNPPQFTRGPVIFALTSSRATALWATHEPATSMLEYGTGPAFGEMISSSQITTRHLLPLADLEPNTRYHFRAGATDAAGNGPAFSPGLTFVTPAATVLEISLPRLARAPGANVRVPISIANVSGMGITALAFDLRFDTSLLNFNAVNTDSTVVESWDQPGYIRTADGIRLTLTGSSALTVSGRLINLDFIIPASAPVGASTALQPGNLTVNGQPVTANLIPGQVLVRDDRAPVITAGPFVNAVTSTSAEINWLTDEPANSRVDYGLSLGYGEQAGQAAFVTNHRLKLTSLRPGTTYHYRVASADSFGNGPTLSNNFTLQTLASQDIMVSVPDTVGEPGQDLILPILVGELTNRDITSCDLTLFFDPQMLQIARVSTEGAIAAIWPAPTFRIENNTLAVTLQGSPALSGQGVLIRLHLQIRSDVTPGTSSRLIFSRFQFNNGTPAAILKNGTVTVNDNGAPVITTGPLATSITSSSALIYWQTDELANSQVSYGTTSNYDKEIKSASFVKTHLLAIENLLPNTEYHYRAQSSDIAGNGPTVSEDLSFVTQFEGGLRVVLPDTAADPGAEILVPIRLDGLGGQNITRLAFELVFDPQIVAIESVARANSLTRDWNPPDLKSSSGKLELSITGTARLTGSGILMFLPVKVKSGARPGARALLLFTRFTFNDGTPPAYPGQGVVSVTDHQPPVVTSGPFVSALGPVSAVILWGSNENSTSLVEYGLTSQYGNIVRDQKLVTQHQIEVSGLTPNTSYHYRVGGVDSLGNGPGWSADAIFTTQDIAGIYVALPDTGAGVGALLKIPLDVRNSSNQTLQAVDLSLVFDATVLELTGVELSGTLAQSWANPTITRSGQVLRVQAAGTAISGSGTLFWLTGKMQADLPLDRTSALIFAEFKANNGDLPVITRNGSVRVIDTRLPQFVQMPSPTRVLFNSATIQWQTDEPTTGRIEYGLDANYGKMVTNATLATAHQMSIFDLAPTTLYHFRVGITDASGNGPVYSPDGTFTTLSGDLHVELPDTSAPAGNFFLLPVRVSQVSGHNITRVEFKLTYDRSILTASGAVQQGTLSASWGQPLFSDGTGLLSLTLSGTRPLEGAGVLVYLGFQVSASATVGTSVPLTVSDFKFNQGTPVPTLIRSGKFTVLEGLPQSPIRVSLPDTFAIAGQELSVPVLVSNVTDRGIVAFNFSIGFNDSTLTAIGLDSSTTMLKHWSKPVLTLARDSLRVSGFGTPALADSGALLYLRFKVRDALAGGLSIPLHWRSFKFNQGNPPVELKDGQIRLQKRLDVIAGFVFDNSTQLPLDSAQVHLSTADGGFFANRLTDGRGYFIFTGLDTTRLFTLTISRPGYMEPAPVTDLRPGIDDLRFYLQPMNGFIEGMVTDKFNLPVLGARISANDGQGSFGSANTDSLGYFRIKALNPSHSFTVTISRFGFHEQQLTSVAVNSRLNIILDYHYASVAGRIKYLDSTAVAEASVILLNPEKPVYQDTTLSGIDGSYRLDEVVAGSYILIARKPGYLSEPEQHELIIGPGETLNANFSLEPAVLASIRIQGSQEVPNHQPSVFYYQALTTSGRQMGIAEPVWQLQPAMAGTLRSGILTPDPGYLGDLRIGVTDRATGIGDTISVSMYAPVGPKTSRTFRNASGVLVQVGSASFPTEQKLKLNLVDLAPIKKSSERATVLGQGFQLKPDNLALDSPILLTLPLSNALTPQLSVGKWQQENAEWLPLETTSGANAGKQISANITALGLYAVLIRSQELGFELVRFRPNPFSPDLDTDNDGHAGLTIHLKITSMESRQPLATIKIYNLIGDLVRELAINQPVAKDQVQLIYWDGRADDGRLARNGRYIVRTEIRDAHSTKEKIDTVVLIR